MFAVGSTTNIGSSDSLDQPTPLPLPSPSFPFHGFPFMPGHANMSGHPTLMPSASASSAVSGSGGLIGGFLPYHPPQYLMFPPAHPNSMLQNNGSNECASNEGQYNISDESGLCEEDGIMGRSKFGMVGCGSTDSMNAGGQNPLMSPFAFANHMVQMHNESGTGENGNNSSNNQGENGSFTPN